MDDIPLPSSPDSPGPPGEENLKKESMKEILHSRESPRPYPISPLMATSFGETYSPSMVTSSPEYTPGEDDNSNASSSTSKRHKGYFDNIVYLV